MSSTSNTTNYFSSFSHKLIPEVVLSTSFLGRAIKHIELKSFSQNSEIEIIFELDSLIKTCSLIEKLAHDLVNTDQQFETLLNSLKEAEFKLYKSGVASLGIKDEPTARKYKDQIEEMTRLVKQYANSCSYVNKVYDNGKTAFFLACEEGDLEKMQVLISVGAKTDIATHSGDAAFHIAATNYCNHKYRSDEIIKFLVKVCPNDFINSKNGSGNTPLDLAIDNFNKHSQNINTALLTIEELICSGAEISKVIDYKKFEKFIYSLCCYGCIDIVKFFLNNSPELINVVNENGETLLHSACEGLNRDMAMFLLDRSPDLLNVQDINGLTALHYACQYGCSDIVELLTSRNAHLDLIDTSHNTALHIACKKGDAKSVRLLLDARPDLVYVVKKYNTSVADFIKTVCQYGSKNNIAALFLRYKTDIINAKNNNYNRPYDLALNSGDKECIDLLVGYSDDGKTVFHRAVENIHDCNKLQIVLSNTDVKNIINIQNADGNTPLDLAFIYFFKNQKKKHFALKRINMLIENGAKISEANIATNNKQFKKLILHSCYSGQKNMVEFLLDASPALIHTCDDEETLLHKACMGSNEYLDIVSLLLERCPDLINTRDDLNCTPLHHACKFINSDTVKLLMDKNADLDLKDNNGNTALHIACQYGNIDTVKLFLNKKPELIQVENDEGETVLHKVCEEPVHKSKKNIIGLLLKLKHDLLNVRNKQGFTPLDIAVANLQKECTELLVELGDKSTTLLHLAIELDPDNISLERIINLKEYINFQDKDGNTPLDLAFNYYFRKTKSERLVLIKMLVENGASVAKVVNNENFENLVIEFVSSGSIELVKFLLNMCPELINTVDDGGGTLLAIACVKNNKDIAELLLEKRPDLINQQDGYKWTPLHYVCTNGYSDIVKLLIDKGADLEIKDSEGDNAFLIACQYGQTEIVNLLLIAKPDLIEATSKDGNSPLDIAFNTEEFEEQDIDLIDLLIKKGCRVSKVTNDKKFQNLLLLSCERGLKETAEYLLDMNPELINSIDQDEMTSLHIACLEGKNEIIKLLLDRQANLDAVDNNGRTPLFIALSVGKIKSAELLINAGVNVKISNKNGISPLHIVCEKYYEDIFGLLVPRLLIEQVSLDAVDENGNTPLMFAMKQIVENPNKDLYIIEELLNGNVDPKIENKKGESPWSILIKSFDFRNEDTYKIAKMFINSHKGVDINRQVHMRLEGSNRTFLMQVAENDEIERIGEFVDNGADLYIQDDNGNSAISIMLSKKNSELLSVLKSLNIDVKKIRADRHGDTPLHIASATSNSELAEYLIELGMDPTVKNIYGNTPVEVMLIKHFSKRNVDIISDIFEKFFHDNESLETTLNISQSVPEFYGFILSMIPNILRIIKEDVNPLTIVLALNNPSVGRAIANELGQEKFQEALANLPNEVKQSFVESLQYNLDDSHLDVKVLTLPEKPEEEAYQIDALLEIFKELTGYDPEDPQAKNPLEQKFKEFFPKQEVDPHTDRGETLQKLYNRLLKLVHNCKYKKHISGIPEGEDELFWERVEKAITNTIKVIRTSQGTVDETYEKKALIIRDYLGLIGYCATKLDIEFEKLYHVNNGEVRLFQDQIYFYLSERRRLVLESLAPRDSQSVHYIQDLLSKLDKYNIPVQPRPDLFHKELNLYDTEASFRNKYLDGLFTDIKNYLMSDKNIQEMFFQWLEEHKRVVEGSLFPREQAKACLEELVKGLSPNSSQMSQKLVHIIEECGIELEDALDSSANILDLYFNPEYMTKPDFNKIMEKGNEAFVEIEDELLKEAIITTDMKGNLNQFITKSHSLHRKEASEKKKIMDRYMQLRSPSMMRKVKDADVLFLLLELGVLKISKDVPQWLL